eukprot:gene2316-2784_t
MAIYFRGFNYANIQVPSSKFSWGLTFVMSTLSLLYYLMSYYVVQKQNFPILPVYIYFYLHIVTCIQSYSNFVGFLRPFWFRVLITIPSSWFQTCLIFQTVSFFLLNKISSKVFTIQRISLVVFLVATFGVYNSSVGYDSVVDINVGNKFQKPLKIVQIADPHLGQFMSVERLRKIAEKTIELKPDIVLLTGDFYTIEAHNEHRAVYDGLEPLKKLKGKVFACLGNHDHEIAHLKEQLQDLDVKLLVDEDLILKTHVAQVHIVGMDYVWENTAENHFQTHQHLFDKKPNVDYRIVLLHNPRHFKYVKKENQTKTIVFSGHLHGGQVGYGEFSFLTFTNLFLPTFPDQGIWCLDEKLKIVKQNCKDAQNLLYVNKGVGYYGLPLKLGIENEESLINLKL